MNYKYVKVTDNSVYTGREYDFIMDVYKIYCKWKFGFSGIVYRKYDI